MLNLAHTHKALTEVSVRVSGSVCEGYQQFTHILEMLRGHLKQ